LTDNHAYNPHQSTLAPTAHGENHVDEPIHESSKLISTKFVTSFGRAWRSSAAVCTPQEEKIGFLFTLISPVVAAASELRATPFPGKLFQEKELKKCL